MQKYRNWCNIETNSNLIHSFYLYKTDILQLKTSNNDSANTDYAMAQLTFYRKLNTIHNPLAPCKNDKDNDDLTSLTVTQGQYVEKAAQFKLATAIVNKRQHSIVTVLIQLLAVLNNDYSLPASLKDKHL